MYYSPYPHGFRPAQLSYTPVYPGYIATPAPPMQGGGQFPAVDTRQFHISARRFKEVMGQADLFIGKLTGSDDFARSLMDAAQKSNQAEVERLIRSAGITVKFDMRYTPDGIRIDFSNSDAENGCCTLRMALSW